MSGFNRGFFSVASGGGAEGPQGASAYQVAVANGFVGDEAAWLLSLVGAQGLQGEQGPQGNQGPAGSGGGGGGGSGWLTVGRGGLLSVDPGDAVLAPIFWPVDVTIAGITPCAWKGGAPVGADVVIDLVDGSGDTIYPDNPIHRPRIIAGSDVPGTESVPDVAFLAARDCLYAKVLNIGNLPNAGIGFVLVFRIA